VRVNPEAISRHEDARRFAERVVNFVVRTDVRDDAVRRY
jgi:hypothetical protein